MAVFAGDIFNKADMAILEKGGPEAVECFVKISRRVYNAGGAAGVRSFVGEALPLLPAHERAEVVTALFVALAAEPEPFSYRVEKAAHTLN